MITDVVTPTTAASYRDLLPGCRLIRLSASIEETRRRAATRPAWLTSDEFGALHEGDTAHPPRVDVTIDVTDLGFMEQVRAVEQVWAAGGAC